MAITPSDFSTQVEGLRTTLKALFFEQFYGGEPLQSDRIVTTIPSTQPIVQLNWLGTVPQMRQWLGDRQPGSVSKHDFSVEVVDWEGTIEIDRNALEDDNLGLIRPKIAELADEAKQHIMRRTFAVLEAATAATCYDGKAFFATDHPIGQTGAVQSNRLTGTGLDTVAHLTTDIQAVVTAFAKFKNDRGQPLGYRPDLFVFPAEAESIVRSTILVETLSTGGANPWYRVADCVFSPFLTDANDWYALVTKRAMKPFVMVERQAPRFTALDKDDADASFFRKRLYYGVDSRFEIAGLQYLYAVKVVNS